MQPEDHRLYLRRLQKGCEPSSRRTAPRNKRGPHSSWPRVPDCQLARRGRGFHTHGRWQCPSPRAVREERKAVVGLAEALIGRPETARDAVGIRHARHSDDLAEGCGHELRHVGGVIAGPGYIRDSGADAMAESPMDWVMVDDTAMSIVRPHVPEAHVGDFDHACVLGDPIDATQQIGIRRRAIGVAIPEPTKGAHRRPRRVYPWSPTRRLMDRAMTHPASSGSLGREATLPTTSRLVCAGSTPPSITATSHLHRIITAVDARAPFREGSICLEHRRVAT